MLFLETTKMQKIRALILNGLTETPLIFLCLVRKETLTWAHNTVSYF